MKSVTAKEYPGKARHSGRKKITREETLQRAYEREIRQHKEFGDYLYAKGYAKSTVERCLREAVHFTLWAEGENIPPDFVVYNDVLHYLKDIREGVGSRTLSARVTRLKHYFTFLEHSSRKAENPAAQVKIQGIKRKTLYDILNHQELESLYHHFPLPQMTGQPENRFRVSLAAAMRDKVILGLIVYQGLNAHELGALEEKDLKLREGRVYIAGSRRSNERALKLESHQVLDMMEYQIKSRVEILQQMAKQSEKLLVSAGSSDQTRSIISRLLKKLHAQNSRISSLNQLRASVITHWLKLYNLRQVQYMAGHRYVSSTESYRVNDLEDLSEEIERYHPVE